MKMIADGFELREVIGHFNVSDWKQSRRDRMMADAKREAAECDCWRKSGPICARCKLAKISRDADVESANR